MTALVLVVALVAAYAGLLVRVVRRRRRLQARHPLQRFAPGRHAGPYDPSTDLANSWRRHAP